LQPLVGRWASENGRTVEAVIVGDCLEFRVLDASQFSDQQYRAGEARFQLRPLAPTTDELAVEDRVRPLPPPGYQYDPEKSRNACLVVRTEAGGRPLRAIVQSDRLTVDFARIEPTVANFVLAGKRIISCRGLQSLRAERSPLVLTRAR
jgi:hypothetical protein